MNQLRTQHKVGLEQIKPPVGSPPAVIVGLGLNGLAVARALHARGIRCIGVGVPDWQPSYATRSCEVVRCKTWSESGLIERLEEIAKKLYQPAPLIVTKEEAVTWVASNRDKLSNSFILRFPEQPILEEMMSKIDFQEIAEKQGWPVPKTLSVHSRSELLKRIDEVPFPCILKPSLKSVRYIRNAPAKAYVIHSEEELLAHYEDASPWATEFVIQEWIGGDDHRIAYTLAYYDKNSKPRLMFAGRKLRQCPIDCGNTAVAAPAPAEWVEPLLSISRQIFDYFNYQGLGSVEFKMRADGSPVIMEPTAGRTNWQSEIAVLNGFDIPSVAYFEMIGAPQLPAVRNLPACKLVHGRFHTRALVQQKRAGRLSLSGWLRERSGRKHYMLWRLSDPMPFVAATIRRTFQMISWLPRRVAKRLKPGIN